MEFTSQATEASQNENPFGMNLEFWNYLNEKEEEQPEASLLQDIRPENSKLSDTENF